MEYLLPLLDRLAEYKDGATAFRDISLAFVGAASLVFLALRAWAMSLSAKAAQKQAMNVQEGAFNDQYIQSLTLLSSEKVSARIGGVYGLGAVAETSNRFRSQSLRVLSVSLREKCKQLQVAKQHKETYYLRVEIQSLLNTLGRVTRDTKLPEAYDFARLDLSGFTFRGDFSNSTFKNTTLKECHFYDARLSHSYFELANFANAKLSRTLMVACEFDNAMFTGTRIANANLSNSSFNDCIFDNVTIENSKLRNVVLTNCTIDANSQKAFNTRHKGLTNVYQAVASMNLTFKQFLVKIGPGVPPNVENTRKHSLTNLSASASVSFTGSSNENMGKETSWLTVYSDSDAVVQAHEVDPVAEADVYIAYNRHEQAEEVLIDGLNSHPDRLDIPYKLLQIYHDINDVGKYQETVKLLTHRRDELSAEQWQTLTTMSTKILGENYDLKV